MLQLNRRQFLLSGAVLLGAPRLWSQDEKGLVVHEWGVFTVAQGATWGAVRTAGATIDARQMEQASNPPEFAVAWTKVVGEAIEKWEKTPRIVTKPVIYCYCKAPMKLNIRVDVPNGRPAVWWPPASEMAPMPTFREPDIGDFQGGVNELKPEKGYLIWNGITLKPSFDIKPRQVAANHWWHTARQTDAVPVSVNNEADTFIFYDALTPVPVAVDVAWKTEDKVTLTNTGKPAIPFALAVRVKDRKAKLAAARNIAGSVELKLSEQGVEALKKGLLEAGLFDKEAEGMAAIWKQEFFEADGHRVIYVMPQPDIEALLPMTITPKPDRLVRVLLVHVECLGPGRAKEIDALIEQLGDDDPKRRKEAIDRLVRLGTLAEGPLRRAFKESGDVQVRQQARSILEALGLKP